MLASMGGVEVARKIRAGDAADVVVLAGNVMQLLEAEGYLVSGTRADFARSAMAMAVRAGAGRPDVANEEAVKQAILNARRICYSSGPSGDHLKHLWAKWGIADVIAPRALQAPPGVPVGEMVARAEADLGFQQLSELLDLPGIDVIDALPPEVQAMTVFSAGVSSASSNPEAAGRFVGYLVSAEAEQAKRRHGIEPA
ncbi:substrate-binding domain-containing protein [Bradyrhizobium sp. Leo121]|uniref:substrate-binding domain-containing protein n=1 Tax=Bradyrhizobium sp. Leo121 TaxID=1571195 RepID=UPI001A90D241|nr:substrate-binding domain-containing protein [Bradyrhizobium sp. Leo121]